MVLNYTTSLIQIAFPLYMLRGFIPFLFYKIRIIKPLVRDAKKEIKDVNQIFSR